MFLAIFAIKSFSLHQENLSKKAKILHRKVRQGFSKDAKKSALASLASDPACLAIFAECS
jgi:hypothetical protein